MGGLQLARRICTLALVVLATSVSGCASLRLNGCTKLAVCGGLAAYTCGDDLVCANHEGETLSSEPVTTSRRPCHICAGF
jgi:hypothetical protein